MPLSTETLSPLTMASFVLDYRMEGLPLQVVARRFTFSDTSEPVKRSKPSTDVTLLLTAGIGYNSELWIPTIRHLFRLQSGTIRVREAWAVDWPNHGDAGVLNELVLKEKYAEVLKQREVAIALRRLLQSGLVDLRNSKLVGVSHSAGTGSHMITDSELGKIPFDTVILIEPPLLDPSTLSFHLKFIARNVAFNKSRQDVWPTLDDAIAWHKKRLPWKMWHPDVLKVLWETNFRDLPTAYHAQTEGVTTKTSKEQDAASFNAAEELFDCADCLEPLCKSVPVHMIFGARKDFWPKELQKAVEKNYEVFRPHLASTTTVPGVGHFIGQEDPHSLATAIFRILDGERPTSKL